MQKVYVYKGAELAAYGFGHTHPFGTDRHGVFHDALAALGLDEQVVLATPQKAARQALALFHTDAYIDKVMEASEKGSGWLDGGDTPAFPGVFDAASVVAGTTMAAVDAILEGQCQRAFVPIAGLHHATRDSAAGFCVFNDCGVAIEYLRERYGIRKIAYVDIDAHHGDGVFYSFEDDPDLIFADIHEDARHLYPGTGHAHETGKGEAEGSKLNLNLAPGATDRDFEPLLARVKAHLEATEPEFVILQCGADSLAGDPITHRQLSPEAHRATARMLCDIAENFASGRLLATGGGGYNRSNLAAGWSAVVDVLANYRAQKDC